MDIVEFLHRQLTGLENDVEAAWEAGEMTQSIRHLIYRDIAAKRWLIDQMIAHGGNVGDPLSPDVPMTATLLALAQPFAEDPDFDPAWKVSE